MGEGFAIFEKKNSSDEKFADAASIELSEPQTAEIMLKLGDIWWELSENKLNKEFQMPLARKACYWYENALPLLESLDKLRIEKRIQIAALNIFKSSMSFPKDAILALSFDPDTVLKRGAKCSIRNLARAGYNAMAYDVSFKKISDNDSVAEFDGVKSKIVIKNPKEDFAKNFTILMWLKSEDNGRRRNPYNKSYGGEGTITLEPNGTINFYFGSAGKDSEPYTSIGCPNAVMLGKWSHIAIVRDAVLKNVSIYLNGEKKAESPYEIQIKSSEKDILIGSGYAGFFKGQMDDFILSNTALSEKEIKKLFKAADKKFR